MTAQRRLRRRRVGQDLSGRGRPPVIAFFGLFGGGNFGNEASLRSAREAVESLVPDARLVCICEVPARVAAEHAIAVHSIHAAGPLGRIRPAGRSLRLLVRPFVELVRPFAAVRFLRGVDAVIVPGTGILDDFGVRPWQMPYDLFLWSLACRLTRTRLFFLSIGAGPIQNRVNRWLMKRAVGFADYCSYRDQTSKDFMASIGRDVTNDPVFPDLAFSLPCPALHPAERTQGRLRVGVGVMSYGGWTGRGSRSSEIREAYLANIVRFCRQLLDSGHDITLLTGEESDDATAARIFNLLEQHLGSTGGTATPRLTAPPLRSMDDVMEAIAATDIVVATRFHNVVAALMMRRPVVSLGYARKNQDLLEAMGLVGFSSHIEAFDAVETARQFRELVDRRSSCAESLARVNAEFASALADQYRSVVGRVPSLGAHAGTGGHTTLRGSEVHA